MESYRMVRGAMGTCLRRIGSEYLRVLALCFVSISLSVSMAQEQMGNESENEAKQRIVDYVSKVMRYSQAVPQEKVYMHFDNTGYFEGDSIWFKAYVTRADRGRATDLSRVLYVELVNPSGDVIKTGKYYIDDKGQARGNVMVDSIFGTGFYEVRAYTRYMTNWGVNAVFSRVFPIFKKPKEEGDYSDLSIDSRLYQERDPNNRDRQDSLYLKAVQQGIYTNNQAKTISVQFYPEGGDMVLGKKSRVAMLAVSDNGMPFAGKGVVVNEQGDVLASVQTDTLGRGDFFVIPDGATLSLKMANVNGKEQRFPLPSPKSDGCVLTLDVVSDSMLATL